LPEETQNVFEIAKLFSWKHLQYGEEQRLRYHQSGNLREFREELRDLTHQDHIFWEKYGDRIEEEGVLEWN